MYVISDKMCVTSDRMYVTSFKMYVTSHRMHVTSNRMSMDHPACGLFVNQTADYTAYVYKCKQPLAKCTSPVT